MKKILLLGLCLSFLGGHSSLWGQEQGGRLSKLMADKLKNAQKLLEGIALSDFTKVASSAEALIQISKTAEWGAYKTPRYDLHSNEFRRAAETIIQKAKNRNIDGVALAYLDLTMTCVRCHNYVREIRDARLGNRPGEPIQ